MDGLSFATATPPVESDPARADIACFIGFVARRADSLPNERAKLQAALRTLDWSGPDLPASERLIPDDIMPAGNGEKTFAGWLRWLKWSGPGRDKELFPKLLRLWFPSAVVDWWSGADYLNSASVVPAVDLLELRDVPVPVDTWDVFDALFAWDDRPISEGAPDTCDTALGAALRSFFAQGGRKCFVVRLDDPWPVLSPANPARLSPPTASAVDRSSWRGLGHLFALPEVSFLCLPDLPDLFATTATGQVEKTPPPTPEVFVECAVEDLPPENRSVRGIAAPRCDADGFEKWAEFVMKAGSFLAGSAREVQFIGAIPLGLDEPWAAVSGIGTAFVQLVYPWLRSPSSPALPGGLEAPDGVLAGALANSALTRGSWRSAIRQPIAGLTAVEPILDAKRLALVRDHVTVIGPAPGGFRLLSDVTTDAEEAYRPANVNRLLNAILRAARYTGASSVFQNSGPLLWRRLRENLTGLLAGLWADGALGGDSPEDAYEVRCDRSTMTQADLDAGRVLCRVSFTAASPIVHLTVVFAMDEGGQLSLVSAPIAA